MSAKLRLPCLPGFCGSKLLTSKHPVIVCCRFTLVTVPSLHHCTMADVFDFAMIFLLFFPGFFLGVLSTWCCQQRATLRGKPLPCGDAGCKGKTSCAEGGGKPLSSSQFGTQKRREVKSDVSFSKKVAYVSSTGDCIHLAEGCCGMKDPKQLRFCKRCFE